MKQSIAPKNLKYLCLLISTLFINGSLFSQDICKYVDEFSDKVYFMMDRMIVREDQSNEEKGIGIGFSFDLKKEELVTNSFSATVIGIGCLDTSSELTIIFENGDKTTFLTWNDFNCDGNAYMYIKKKQMDMLRTNKISKMKFMNRRNYESVTNTEIEDGEFLMTAIKNMDAYNNTGQIEICKDDD